MKSHSDCLIFHVDVNSAYLSWESCERKKKEPDSVDLRTIPSAIGGDQEKRHGVILAKSTLAKSYGITTGETIYSALKKCPNLVLVPPNHALYKNYSKQLIALLENYAPCVEQFSIDEAFCDMSHTQLVYGDPITSATRLKEKIKEELGFTVNIGISSNKVLAKMASDFEKPDKIHTLFPEEVEEKIWPLPVRKLFSVGRATERKLKELGIYTIGELAKTDITFLTSHLKKQGEVIHSYANGNSISFIEKKASSAKGYSNEVTIPFDVEDASRAKWILLSLSETVCRRMRESNVLGVTLSITITYQNFVHVTHQRTLLTPTNTTDIFYHVICELFDELWNGTPIRLLGCGANKITADESEQLNLFETKNAEKYKKLDGALDSIRKKFGDGAIKRASFLEK